MNMYRQILFRKLGYGVCSICFLNFGILSVKKKTIITEKIEALKWNNPATHHLSKIALCEAPKIQSTKYDRYKLVDAHVFFRHGARTPLSNLPGLDQVTYDKDKLDQVPEYADIPFTVKTPDGKPRPQSKLETHYKKVQFQGGMIAGTLTIVGRQQAFELGKRLRQRYIQDIEFVKDSFNIEEIAIRSTNVERCVQSLRSVLAGMFGKASFKEEVIIPVVPLDAEILFPNYRFCDTLRQLEHKAPGYLMEQHGYQFVSHYIKYFTKQKDDKFVQMMYWRDNMVARQTHDLPVPLWLEAIEEQVQMWATKSLEIFMCGVPQDRLLVLQLAAGPMLNLVVEGFNSALDEHKHSPRLHLYSCHDSSLMPLLVSLGVFDHKWPPYSADVALELYTTPEKELFVKISYCNQDITFPGYETPMIPYNKFVEIVSPYVVTPSQYMKRCHDIDLAREHAQKWEAVVKSHEQEEEDDKTYDFPPNM